MLHGLSARTFPTILFARRLTFLILEITRGLAALPRQNIHRTLLVLCARCLMLHGSPHTEIFVPPSACVHRRRTEVLLSWVVTHTVSLPRYACLAIVVTFPQQLRLQALSMPALLVICRILVQLCILFLGTLVKRMWPWLDGHSALTLLSTMLKRLPNLLFGNLFRQPSRPLLIHLAIQAVTRRFFRLINRPTCLLIRGRSRHSTGVITMEQLSQLLLSETILILILSVDRPWHVPS